MAKQNIGSEQFLDLVGGDLALARELVSMFEADYQILIKEIRSGLQANDAATVERASHRLKGNLRNFYAAVSSQVAGEIEDGARGKNMAGLDDKLLDLEVKIEAVLVDLRALVKG